MSLLSRLAVQAARAYGVLSSKGGVSASYLVVAGGGAGGDASGGGPGGGGGAGGFRTGTSTLSTLNTYTVVVGSGGAGVGTGTVGGSGGTSSISGTGITTITSAGGGGGGYASSSATVGIGVSGGSGGGAGWNFSSGGTGNTPSTSPSQGSDGGATLAPASTNLQSAGGGGATAVGGNGTSLVSGAGGAGTASSISGSSVTYAGGGGGSSFSLSGGAGGAGGGGAGGTQATVAATAGTVNTGGGGGGGANYSGYTGAAGKAGGSGVVIISYTSATPKFVGGTLTTSGGNQIHTFTSSGTLSPITPITASYLVVAGGGSGGIGYAGGGGAGGLLTGSTTLYSGATYVVTVGAGGTATGTNVAGGVGGNSVLSGTGLTTLTSTGGGGGAGFVLGQVATAGGSGGGGMYSSLGGYGNPTGGAGTSGQGFAGGTPAGTGGYFGGGGGGSSAVGANGSGSSNATSTGGAGGAGTASSISGSSVTYAGGGGGGSYNSGAAAGVGGSGGGGAGSKTTSTTGGSGTTNTGGGGGGACDGVTTAGSGGSGIVIISYAGSQVFNGGLVTSSGGNTIHTFLASGALTPLTNNLTNSLRFRASASAYLSRTPTLATNRRTWTLSMWIKRGSNFGSQSEFFTAGTSGSNYLTFQFDTSNRLALVSETPSLVCELRTTSVYRDPAAWYHITLAVDTTQATSANRLKLYVNGNQVTAFATATYPTQNTDLLVNSAVAHYFSHNTSGGGYFDGYDTDINFIDGQALEPYYFGNNDAYGNWKPILYKGMYGTNGFYLTFADASAATAAAIGKDSSPNGNNWTPSGISVTAGSTYDAMLDVPTNTSATVANYCVNNPVDTSPAGGVNAITISGANLNLAGASTDWAACRATIGVTSGKWYWECTRTGASNLIFGIGLNSTTLVNAYSSTSYGYFSTGDKYSNNVATAYGASFTSGDVIGVAFDADAGTLTFYKNNTSQGTAFTGLTSGPYFPLNQLYTTGSTASINFGQRPFSYTPPTGFVALNTYNLPTPTILQGNKYMDATLYTANASTQVVINQGQFKPDFVWTKSRTNAYSSNLYNSISGVNKYLQSNNTGAEASVADTLTSFNTNGFTVGAQDNANYTSGSAGVGWQWQAGQGSSSSNTSGTITSTVSVNTTAGFSVVTYTGNATNPSTVGHGLGVAPKMIITKQRNAGTYGWNTYHASLGNTQYVALNTTDAAGSSVSLWNNTSPTSTVFTINHAAVNSATTYVAYCWAEIAGFSKFGSYTGNGSADGPFIYTGFRPKYIVLKSTTTAGSNWWAEDTSRSTYNAANALLFPNLSNAEYTTAGVETDILSNGFKLRTSSNDGNKSGDTFIYMAFAENPFKNSNAR